MSPSPRTEAHAPPSDQDCEGFGIGRSAYENATTARSRRLVLLSKKADDAARRAERGALVPREHGLR